MGIRCYGTLLPKLSSPKSSAPRFNAHIDRRVAAQPAQAALGGVPSVANKVKGFVRVMHYKEGRWRDDIEVRSILAGLLLGYCSSLPSVL